jgi:hypothetical protein
MIPITDAEFFRLWDEIRDASKDTQQPMFSFIAAAAYGQPEERVTTLANGICEKPERAVKLLSRYSGDYLVN